MTIRSFEEAGHLPPPRRIVIVGAGAVGLSMAVALARRGIGCTVLEGGPRVPPIRYAEANRALSVGHPHLGLHSGRLKAYGGTTHLWGGQLVPFDPGDFAARDAEGRALWPIGHGEVAPWIDAAYALLGVPEAARDTLRIWRASTGAEPAFGPRLVPGMNIWLPEPNFTRLFGPEIEHSPLIDLVTDARLSALRFDDQGAIAEATVTAPSGAEARFCPGQLVLAQGTIETVATLLRAAASDPACPFAANPHLGRWFIDHLHGLVGTIDCTDPARIRDLFDTFVTGGFKYNVKLRAPRPPEGPNLALSVNPAITLREVAAEAAGLARRVLRQPGSAFGALGRMARAGLILAPAAWRYIVRRRATTVMAGGLMLGIELEQLPRRDSRLTLEPGVDPATAQVVLDWVIDGGELERAAELCAEAAAAFAAQGLGTITLDPRLLARDRALFDTFHDSNHQMGGARMAASADQGVVDADAQVFGTSNLHLAGGAILPTGSFANCTLTSIALGLRLADRLAGSGAGAQAPQLLPRLVYGTARLDAGVSAARGARLLGMVLDAGVRAVDTAPLYGLGGAEAVVGAVLRRHPAGSAVRVYAKAGLPRPPLPLVQSALRAAKRRLRAPRPQDLEHWVPVPPARAGGRARLDPAFLARSLAASAARLGRIDHLLLHEATPDELTDERAEALRTLASAHGATPGYGVGAHYDAAIDALYPDDFIGECGVHPGVLTGAVEPPARPVLFHSIMPTARYLERTDPQFAEALTRAAALLPGIDPATARIAAVYALLAARAPMARLVFASTDPARLDSLLTAFTAIDRGGLIGPIAACFGVAAADG